MKITFSRILFSFMVLGLLFTSCEEDTPGGGGGTGNEEIVLNVTTSSAATVAPGDTIYVTMVAEEGPSPLATITVSEDGVNLPLERVLFDGAPAANPLALTGSDKVSFTKEVGVIVSTDPGLKGYLFTVTDDAGNSKGGQLDVTIESTPPALNVVGSGVISAAPNSFVAFTMMATKGTGDIDQIRVDIDGVTLADFADVEFGGVAFSSNPETLTGDDRVSFDKKLEMRVPNTPGTYIITLSIIDAAGNVVSDDITVLVGTTPNVYMESVFFNRAGSGNGGMDLDNGMNVSSTGTEAEIRDLGVDDNIDPAMEENWFKKIEATNGAVLKKLVPGMNGLSETFTFESVQFTEDIIALVDNQTDLAEGTNTGVISVGDMFIVGDSGGTKVYVFLVKEVNEVSGSNDDNYVIDIKTTK